MLLPPSGALMISLFFTPLGLAAKIDFQRDIQPILSDACYTCHGPDKNKRKSGLRLDQEAGAKAALKGDPVRFGIVEHNPESSEIVKRIRSADQDDLMPPPESRRSLTAEEIELLVQWVREGAHYASHWSFEPPRKSSVPEIENPPLHATAIDSFIMDRMKQSGLQYAPEADKLTLLRRVTLDLIGLPPTPEDIDAFLADKSPAAYERVIDGLMADSGYGEHMAIHWLAAARYADTSGFQSEEERGMWPWRDWVVRAFNQNLPFDKFTLYQLAGDMLESPTEDSLIASAFNRHHGINHGGGVITDEAIANHVADRLETTATTWLGLTVGCARCHDHKYDPISMRDYYRMYAYFNRMPRPPEEITATRWQNPYHAVGDRDVEAIYQADQKEIADIERRYKALVRKRVAQEWEVFEPLVADTGSSRMKMVPQPDGAWLVETDWAEKRSRYTLIGTTSHQQVQYIQLEALPHASLAKGGVSHSDSANFVLTYFTVEARNMPEDEWKAVKISSVEVDYAQSGYPGTGTLDEDPETGWAGEGNVYPENRQAVWTLAEPLNIFDDTELRLVLHFDSPYPYHSIAHFRVSLSSPTYVGPLVKKKKASALTRKLKKLGVGKLNMKKRSPATPVFDRRNESINRWRTMREERADRMARLEDYRVARVMVMADVEDAEPTYLLKRGLYDQPDTSEELQPGVPEVFGVDASRFTDNRLGLVKWLMSPGNPLTARVAVNRYWQLCFGRGLVETQEDFGVQGALPTHPELLDWLAVTFIESGWDTKALHKRMLMSAAYRQQSGASMEKMRIDPDNKLLARAPRIRLTGFQIRDQALSMAGSLVRFRGGAPVKPYQPYGLWREMSFLRKGSTTDIYVQDHGQKLYRRGLYVFWKRSLPPPQFSVFDEAPRVVCSVRTRLTNTPLQALVLLNETALVEAARNMAERLMKDRSLTSVDERVRQAFKLAGMHCDADTVDLLCRGFAEHVNEFRKDPAAVNAFLSVGESVVDDELDRVVLAAFSVTCSTILNLDQAINRE